MEEKILVVDTNNIATSIMQNTHVKISSSVSHLIKTQDYLITNGAIINFINFSDPTNPHITETIEIPDVWYLDIKVANEILIARRTNGDVFFYNITNFSNITEITSLVAEKGYLLEVKQEFLYLIRSPDEGGFGVFNISNLNNITKVNEYLDMGRLITTTRFENYLYGYNEYSGLNIINITSIDNMKRINKPIENSYKSYVQFKNDYALFAGGHGGLEVYNIKRPNNPKLVWQDQNSGFATDIAIRNTYVYLANGYNGLTIYDISQIDNPIRIKTIELEGFITNVVLKDDICITSQEEHGITIFNISNPETPETLSEYTNGTINVQRALIGNDTLYLATLEHGLEIINITNPTTPIYVKSLSSNERATCATIVNNHLIYTSEAGINFYEIYDNNTLSWKSTYLTEKLVSDVIVHNNRLLFSYFSSNAVILQMINLTSFDYIAETHEGRILRIIIHNDLLYTTNGLYGANIYSFDNNQNNIADYYEPLIITLVITISIVFLIAIISLIVIRRKRSSN